jgi:Uma2 family endonuclease
MEQALAGRRKYTVEEYLAFEDQAEDKHEYRDGDILDRDGNVVDIEMPPIVDMAGADEAHLQIDQNLSRRLGEQLDGSGCVVRGSDQRVRTDRGRYCYPDKTIACGPLMYDPPERRVVLVNPTVIFEILSPTTEAFDRGEKFTRYRAIPSLLEYILVAQDRPRVEPCYRQPDGIWAIGGMVEGLEATLKLRTVPAEVRLADLYAGVRFPQSIERQPLL